MEVPPGRVERIADGGPEAIRSILAELRAMKFNGVLKTSVFRGDTPSQGVLVLRRGDGVLAEHRSAVDVAGHEALPEILKDAASARAQLEVRTYDYGHSSISIDHLQRSYPEAAVEGIGDPDEVLDQAIAQEAREREVYEKQLEARRGQERTLLERERKQMNDLYANLQAEAEKISEARKTFDERLGEAERRERLLTSQDQAIRDREQKLRDHLAGVSQRERVVEEREKSLPRRLAELEGREAELAEKSAKVAKQAEAYETHDAGLDDQREELERATKRMQKLAKDLAAKDRKISEEEREARERQVDIRRRQRDLATRGKELDQLKRRLERMDEELSANRSTMKAQAVKLLRSERAVQGRLGAIEAADRALNKREADAKRREAAIEKREKAAAAV